VLLRLGLLQGLLDFLSQRFVAIVSIGMSQFLD
jgi:hypothetical protein